jgi:hypothetical protein
VSPGSGRTSHTDARSGELPLIGSLLERHAARSELVAPGAVDVAVPEAVAEPEVRCEREDTCRSDRASPRGGTSGRRRCTSACAASLTSNPIRRGLGLERARHGKHDVGLFGGGVQEQVGVDEEVERGERRPPACAVAVGHDQVRAEVDQSTRPVRGALEGRGVEVLAGDIFEAGRAQRPLLHTEGLGPLLRGEQLDSLIRFAGT